MHEWFQTCHWIDQQIFPSQGNTNAKILSFGQKVVGTLWKLWAYTCWQGEEWPS